MPMILATKDRKETSVASWMYMGKDDELCVSSKFGTFRLGTVVDGRRFDLLEYSFPFFTWTLSPDGEDADGNRWYRWRYSSLRDQIVGIEFAICELASKFRKMAR